MIEKLMKNIFLLLVLITLASCVSIGKKCTYTQEGTRIESWIWFTKEVPADLDKMNCN